MSEPHDIVGHDRAQHPAKPHANSFPGQKQNPFEMTNMMSALRTSSDQTSPSEPSQFSAVRIRNIASNTSLEKLHSILEFLVKDFERVDLIDDETTDANTQTAIARFKTPEAAQEAQGALNGRQLTPNRPKEPYVVVEIVKWSPGSIGTFGGQFDVAAQPPQSAPLAPKFGEHLQSGGRAGFGDYAKSKSTDNLTSASYFPSSSDLRPRVSGRDVIGQDGPDEDTSDLLRDPLGYANNDMSVLSRRSTGSSQRPTRYGPMGLRSSNTTSPAMSGYNTPRPGGIPSSHPSANPSLHSLPFQMRQSPFPRSTMPPVNPADQNPPCNTLYVGNLPVDTSEDELKAMFSKQRGYKRLCFRTKQNGPMCFVEFEDVSFATKALNELYGYPLHNSAHRGGIRLSFSKNPLGVRNTPPAGLGQPMPSGGQYPDMNPYSMQSYPSASGPPPGIPTPPGLPSSSSASGTPSQSGQLYHGGSGNYVGMPNSGLPGPSSIGGAPFGFSDMQSGLSRDSSGMPSYHSPWSAQQDDYRDER